LTVTVGQLPTVISPALRLVEINPAWAKSLIASKVVVATIAFFSTELSLKGVLLNIPE